MDKGESSSIGEVNNDISDEPFKPVPLVRILWIDNSGIHRCRVIPRERLSFVSKHGLGLSPAFLAALSSVFNVPAEGSNLTYTGVIRIIPDLSTRCKIPWEKHQEMTLADMCTEPDKPWEYCPREVFRKACKILKDEFDIVAEVGFEIEFYLLKSVIRDGKEEWFPIDKTSYCSTSAFEAASSVLEDIVSYLQMMNIEVEKVHAETGKGQFEVVLGHAEASTAIASLIYAREVIRSVARQLGLLATFVPKYTEDEDGSGSHIHISLSRNGENVFVSPQESHYGMSSTGTAFMAGVIRHLPAIYAFTQTHPLSYEHMMPKTRNAAYACWGTESTETPVRACRPPGIGDGFVDHFEIRAFDACANPYLGLASIIIAGVDGLRDYTFLPIPVEGDMHCSMNPDKVPDSISESLIALEADPLFSEVMSENLLTTIKAIRKMEVKNYCDPVRDYSVPGPDVVYKDPLKDIIFKF